MVQLDVKKYLPLLKELQAPKGMTAETQISLYRTMCTMRAFDMCAKRLAERGEIYGVVHTYEFAEAIGAGAITCLQQTDYIATNHRGHGHAIAKGADLKGMMAELFGKYEGLNKGKGGSMHIADHSIGMAGATGIVGSGIPLSLGAGLASRVLQNDSVSLCFHGDGSTNQGVWLESLNMAALWNLPVIFLIENNQYGAATTVDRLNKQPQLYLRAAGFGVDAVRVDGLNVFDVYKAVHTAVDKARRGEGPTVIEAMFLRIGGHHNRDTQLYREDREDVLQLWEYCPIKRLNAYLLTQHIATEAVLSAIMHEAEQKVQEAVDYAKYHCSEPAVHTLYEDLYDCEIIR